MRKVTDLLTLSSRSSWGVVTLAAATVLLLGGCQALAITAAGIGASTGLTHTANSISSRTFTAPKPHVRQATVLALERMGIKVEGTSTQSSVETIRASVADRTVEIEVESLNQVTTRISASAQRGAFVFDGATAREIVAQTELAMTELTQSRRARAPSKTSSALADASSGPTAVRR